MTRCVHIYPAASVAGNCQACGASTDELHHVSEQTEDGHGKVVVSANLRCKQCCPRCRVEHLAEGAIAPINSATQLSIFTKENA